MGIERPADLLSGEHQSVFPVDKALPRCLEHTPAWGWEADYEYCQRVGGHDGPHYYEDGQFTVQWEAK